MHFDGINLSLVSAERLGLCWGIIGFLLGGLIQSRIVRNVRMSAEGNDVDA